MFMGAFRMNGFGQRKFLNDGTFVHSVIDEQIDNLGYKLESTVTNDCSEISLDITIPKIYSIEALPEGEVLNLFCKGENSINID